MTFYRRQHNKHNEQRNTINTYRVGGDRDKDERRTSNAQRPTSNEKEQGLLMSFFCSEPRMEEQSCYQGQCVCCCGSIPASIFSFNQIQDSTLDVGRSMFDVHLQFGVESLIILK